MDYAKRSVKRFSTRSLALQLKQSINVWRLTNGVHLYTLGVCVTVATISSYTKVAVASLIAINELPSDGRRHEKWAYPT